MGITEDGSHAPGAGRQGACRAACSRSCRRNFRRASTASTAALTRISSLKELQRLRAGHAHRRQPQAVRGRNRRSADRRGRAAERRRRQFRRHRLGHDRRAAQPAHPRSHRRLRPGADAARRGDQRRRRSRRARWPIRAWPRRSAFTSAATRDRKSMLRCAMATRSCAHARSRLAADGSSANRNPCCSTPALPARRRCSSRLIRCPARKIATTTPSRAWSTWNPTSAASSTSKASRAGNTSSSAAPKMTTASCKSSPCCAPPRTRSIARALTIRRNWPTVSPRTAEDLFDYQALIIGSVEASYFTPAQQELIQQFVDRRGGGLLLLGGRFSLADGGWGASTLADLLPVTLPNRKGHVSARSCHRRADAGGRGQHDLPPGRRSREERRALEEASLPDELSGSRARRSPARRCWRK